LLLWIQKHDNADAFWIFLQTCDVIRKGHDPNKNAYYRIRVHAHSFEAEEDDKEIVWQEMKTLTLKIWHDTGAVGRGYVNINIGASEDVLCDLISGELLFTHYKNIAPTGTLASAAAPSLEALMLQLQTLAHGV
jgi:hypothetical protein